ncbi:MAG: DEAD/DEAH box helicase [Chlorobi bacterium]|nr:DEAD/DEAH box helicase [Chlorobiota bacterium]
MPQKQRSRTKQSQSESLHYPVLFHGYRGSGYIVPVLNLSAGTLVITADEEEASECTEILSSFGKKALFLPSSVEFIGDAVQIKESKRKEREMTIARFKDYILCCDILSALEKTTLYKEKSITVKTEQTLDIDQLEKQLKDSGFEPVEEVVQERQYSFRGSILDIWALNEEFPYRITLDDETVERITLFNPEDQLSFKEINKCKISLGISKSKEPVSPLELANTIVLKDPDILEPLWSETLQTISEKIVPTQNTDIEFSNVKYPQIFEKSIIISRNPLSHFTGKEEVLHQSPVPVFSGEFMQASQFIQDLINSGLKVFLHLPSELDIKRFKEILKSYKTDVKKIIFKGGTAGRGFIDYDLSEAHIDLFNLTGFHKKRSVGKKRISKKLFQEIVGQFKEGDYVVHMDFGIAQFTGITQVKIKDRYYDAIRLVFKNDDILYLSPANIDKIVPYTGQNKPTLSSLRSSAWKRLKQKVKQEVYELSKQLSQIYARRILSKGYAFVPDDAFQLEMEALFQYEETPDQLKAISDVKADMESAKPMERLICGDVGFGKTEIALRATFKAVRSGKQVAILVPTTLLAYQHWKVFKERLERFGVVVEYLSRTRSASTISKIRKVLSEGKIDVVIGTHALISDNTVFANLGLLIVDEEHKFGVLQKEKLKAKYPEIDILYLSATPIPRTLKMALSGIRDISIIETPPSRRLEVKTYVGPWQKDLFVYAIEKELSRGGSVFIVNPRIKGLENIKKIVKQYIPQAKTVIAHGGLEGAQLEQTLIDFAEGRYNVLISTAIIGSGLDLPHVNTLIVMNAHMFGLAELHQLRGRVGRGDTQAYCYMFVPSWNRITSKARERLLTLLEYQDLGSGFSIALKDMELRGPGMLLGKEQSGFVRQMGIDAYYRLIEESIRELQQQEKPEEVEKWFDTTIETNIPAFIPETYIASSRERLSLYLKLSQATSREEIEQIQSEITDRFGKPPQEVLNLIALLKTKHLASRLGITKLVIKDGYAIAHFPSDENHPWYKSKIPFHIYQFIARNPNRFQLKPPPDSRLVIKAVPSINELFIVLRDMVSQIKIMEQSKG